MARFRSVFTGSVVNVDDSKADRFTVGWEPVDSEKKPASKPAARKKTENK